MLYEYGISIIGYYGAKEGEIIAKGEPFLGKGRTEIKY